MGDRHLQIIAERGRMAWQKASGYYWRALMEADISRFKRRKPQTEPGHFSAHRGLSTRLEAGRHLHHA